MYLADTNIFLEILLKQNKSESCKSFLNTNLGNIKITDFTLHSIGVILFRQNKDKLFLKFVSDILPKIQLVSLPISKYENVIRIKKKYELDFDDSYQYSVCKELDLKLATLDNDFRRVDDSEIEFI